MLAADLKRILGDDYGEVKQARNERLAIYNALMAESTNELNSPELLPYNNDLVESMNDIIVQQIDYVDGIPTSNAFQVFLYRQEIERLKYVMRRYLRFRLDKIERYSHYCLLEERYKLSEDELFYCQRFQDIVTTCHTKSFLVGLPENLQSLGEEEIVRKPNLDDGVFCRVVNDIGRVETKAEDVVMMEGDIFLLRYRTVRQLVLEKSVILL